MANTASAMLAECRKHIGYTEYGNNGSMFGAWYGLNYQPWCDMLISYCASKTGNADVIGKFAYTVYHAQWFQARGQWITGDVDGCNKALPGDIVFFDWGGTNSIAAIDHVGIVVKSLGNGNVQTIEGNVGNNCDYHNRNSSVIAGFGRPRYTNSPTTPVAPVSSTPVYPGYTLQLGSTGEAVKLVQKKLGGLEVDGDFGMLTETSVKNFQRKNKLIVDGCVGPVTWKALFG